MEKLPQDLEAQYKATKALALVYTLLQNGFFPGGIRDEIEEASKFIQSLHNQSLQAVLVHPESDMIDEIKKHKEGQIGEANTQDNSSSSQA